MIYLPNALCIKMNALGTPKRFREQVILKQHYSSLLPHQQSSLETSSDQNRVELLEKRVCASNEIKRHSLEPLQIRTSSMNEKQEHLRKQGINLCCMKPMANFPHAPAV